QRQWIIDLMGSYRIGVADDEHVRDGSLRDLGVHVFDDLPGFVGQLVLAFDEVQREFSVWLRLRGERRTEEHLHFLLTGLEGLRSGGGQLRGRIRLAKRNLAVALL